MMNWRTLTGLPCVFTLVGVLCIVALMQGCDRPTSSKTPGTTDSTAITEVAADFFKAVPDVGRIFAKNQTAALPNIKVEVFVDATLSMQGYVAALRNKKGSSASAGVVDSDFFNLLTPLSNRGEVIEFSGFGSNKEGGKTTIIERWEKLEFTNTEKYRRENNDYADLLDQIAHRKVPSDGMPIARIIVTDGVQSNWDPAQGSALNLTVQRLQGWVENGGAVELRLFTAPFSGTYYSETLRSLNSHPSTVTGSVERRPFLVISLISKKEHLPALTKFWEEVYKSGLKPAAYLCYPPPQETIPGLAINPLGNIPKDISVTVQFRDVWKLSRMATLDSYNNDLINSADVHQPQTPTDPRPPFYPACFQLKGLTPESLEAELEWMKLEVWHRVPASREAKGAPTPPASAIATGSSPAFGKEWKKIQSVDLRDLNNRKVKIDKLTAPQEGFRFKVDLPTPEKNDVNVVVVTAKPRGKLPQPPDWENFSTRNDVRKEDLNKIYNLRDLVIQMTPPQKTDPAAVGTVVFTYH